MRKSKNDAYTDEQLTALWLHQAPNAFELIYRHYFKPIYHFSHKMLADEQQAEDATQQLFANLLEKKDQLEITSIKSYLFKSIRNIHIDLARSKKTRIDYITAFKDIYAKGEYSTDNQVIENDLIRQIEKEIENLPPRMKAIFKMSRQQYLSNKEIAEAQGLSQQTVKNVITTAMEKLRRGLSDMFLLNLMWLILWWHKK
ncbi:hypothetical protein DBR11_20865 [Pedobacter sp. HMWF019]|uniref:RNA polymerase sigma factor n=1 Tax=Pedobacter sp. HMWF019 TaxID=2056856 RepID=UPI000D3C8BED|nr:RNA polymerase sigma-70 factor [Pedobacter sp. HMWF019]PTS95633.1 hypothetical protein DBR11_20865 [Pedobacter sp. HMWF019]